MTARLMMTRHWRFFFIRSHLVRFRYHGVLSLVPADGRARDLDSDFVRDLHLNRLLVQLRNLAVDAARGHDFVADLERLLELLHLFLAALHREENQEIEDGQDQRKRQELKQPAGTLTRARHRNYLDHQMLMLLGPSGEGLMKLLTEFFKRSETNSFPDAAH